MGYVSLYRRFRPDTFEGIIGQDHIVRTLTNQVISGRISHAYLFTGTRGTGKTSVAKIFARAVNCAEPYNGSPCGKCYACVGMRDTNNLDVIEIDAASNNGVDEIRELRDSVKFKPSIGKYKVYIIDEVHMLSISAFNALLKTLEEPPEHVIFCLATTEAQKLPATILSRCLRFDFRLVAKDKIAVLIKDIFSQIDFKCDDKGIDLIAIHGEGSVRDALSIADMAVSYGNGKISYKELLSLLGTSDINTLSMLADAVLSNKTEKVLELFDNIAKSGKGILTLMRDVAEYFSLLIRVKNIKGYDLGGYASEEDGDTIRKIAKKHDNYKIARVMELLSNLEGDLRYSTQPQILFQAILIQASELKTTPNIEALLSRMTSLEKDLKTLKNEGLKITPLPAREITHTLEEATTIEVSKIEKEVSTEDNPWDDYKKSADNKDYNYQESVREEETSEESLNDSFITENLIEVNDGKQVFFDNQDDKEEVAIDVKVIYAKLVTHIIKDDTTGLMRMPLQSEDNVILKDNLIVLKTKSQANYNYINHKDTLQFINKTLAKIAENMRFVCEMEHEDKNYDSEVDLKGRLKTLFPKELIIKNKNR